MFNINLSMYFISHVKVNVNTWKVCIHTRIESLIVRVMGGGVNKIHLSQMIVSHQNRCLVKEKQMQLKTNRESILT